MANIESGNGENPCLARKCARCCTGRFIGIDDDQLRILTTNGKEQVRWVKTYKEILDHRQLGWAVRERFAAIRNQDDGTITTSVYGWCPNLGSDNRCVVYEERPPVCRGLEPNGEVCRKIRRRFGPIETLKRIIKSL